MLHGRWFLDLDVFHKNYARARDEQGWHHVDIHGQPLYQDRYRNVEPFYNGQARVEGFDGSLSVIGEMGETLVELRNPLRTLLEELSGDMVGMWKTQAIRAAVELGVFESLPASAEVIEKSAELADFVGARLMRALTELGLVQTDAKGVYHATDKGALLQRSHLHSLADAASLWGSETYEVWADASYSLRTGRSAFRKLYGKNLFELLKDRPEQLQSSHRAFASYARHDYQSLAGVCDFGSHSHILDAGGGTGELAFAMLRAYPNLTATIMDLPEVVRHADSPDDLNDRCQFVTGDLFKKWPIRSDAAVLARVLHDWPDDDAQRILTRAREAMPTGGALFVVEMVLDDATGAVGLLDMNMLIVAGGAERTVEQFRDMLHRDRFRDAGRDFHRLGEFHHQGQSSLTAPDPVVAIKERLAMVPEDVNVSLVIRHAESKEIPVGTFGHNVNLTAQGLQAAEQLGAALSEKRTINVVSSPVPRCVQTAQGILDGAGSSAEIITDRRLGDPGAFIVDPEIAGPLFLELPIPEIARHQLQDATPLPGMRRTKEGVAIFLDLVTKKLGGNGRLDMFVTHDVILAVLVGSILGLTIEETGWPDFLEGLLVWRSDSFFHASWRETRQNFCHPLGR